MDLGKTALVVPSIRKRCIDKFLAAWIPVAESYGVHVIIVEDNPERSFDLPYGVTHYSWADIDVDLGDDAWIIPRRTDCVRSYGYLKAVEYGAESVITLDDDCFPAGRPPFFESHVTRLKKPSISTAWDSVIPDGKQRGMPLNKERRWPTVINVGLWHHELDFSADYRLTTAADALPLKARGLFGSSGTYVPACGMNMSFMRMALPMMYFLLMGRNYPFDRFGDIWCGLFAKRICDDLRLSMHFGNPFVDHRQASNPFDNLIKEAPGMKAHEELWRVVDDTILTTDNIPGNYLQLADAIESRMPSKSDHPEYWPKLAEAMRVWIKLAGRALKGD
jgi:hypothetical protein